MTAGFIARAVWAWLCTPLGRRVGLGLVAALALVALLLGVRHGGYVSGVAHEQAAQAERLRLAKKSAAKTTAKAAAIGQDVGARVEKRQAEIRTITRTLIERVPIYVTAESDRRCDVPAGFVSLLDSAATGRLPDAAATSGGAAEASSGIALSAVGASIADNYGAARENAEQLKGWQDYWRRLSPLFSGPP